MGSCNPGFRARCRLCRFALRCLCRLAFSRLFIKLVLGQTLHLSDTAWRTLPWRWSLFFIALAITNEIVGDGTSAAEAAPVPIVLAFPGEGDDRALNLLHLRADTNYRVPRL